MSGLAKDFLGVQHLGVRCIGGDRKVLNDGLKDLCFFVVALF
jgi:hypothetical protein